ncbi:GntR family transcriptional regulator [Halostella sp. JP-L12]|uniref:helix-turn-helix transcriptional regulator n=1 Tax=Halostella TaxID=1843185 RepID=UPI0013CE9109|nr:MULTISPECIES: helix-turn-helix domain-containing protein [Halostella]NHN46724.1 GntR family transcriptional regulator [Halostella sp. JP-L12]
MTATDPEKDVVDVLARRIEVLDYLADSAAGKERLVADLSVSRSTVNRALRELEGLGFLTRVDGEYTASTTGRLVARQYREFVAGLEDSCDAQAVLAGVDPSAEMSPAMVRGATVYLAEPPTPFRPIQRITELATDADEFLGLSASVAVPESIDDIADAVLRGDLRAEFVVADRVAQHLRANRADAIEAANRRETLSVYVADDLPYGLGIAYGDGDAHAFVVTYGEDGDLRGAVVNDSPEAVEWAEGVYRRYRATATELPPPAD